VGRYQCVEASNLQRSRRVDIQPSLRQIERPTRDAVLLIGLTGNIASGKSEVARIFADLGATVIDADELAREAVRPGTPALAAIGAHWGERVLNPDGSLNRAAMRAVAFSNEADRKALNAIVHPAVKQLRDRLVDEARRRGDAVVVAAIPLLYEAGLERDYDRVVLVDAPDDVRLSRLVHRRAISAVEAQRMMAAQTPAAMKRERADFVIDNKSDLEALRRSVEHVWRELTTQANE